MSKQHIREQRNAFSSFLKIKMKEPEDDPRRTSYVFISKENQASVFKEGYIVLPFNRNSTKHANMMSCVIFPVEHSMHS